MPPESDADGQSTRERMLDTGLAMASELGLKGLTVGNLTRAVGLSKAGLYAHFDSKEDLLLAILEEAVDRFVRDGVRPALQAPAGAPRVRALFEAWLAWTQAPPLPGGCVFISSAAELDDRSGPLRDFLVETQQRWREMLREAVERAVAQGDFREDLDPDQFVHDLFGIVLAFHYHDRLFRDRDADARARRSFETMMERAARETEAA